MNESMYYIADLVSIKLFVSRKKDITLEKCSKFTFLLYIYLKSCFTIYHLSGLRLAASFFLHGLLLYIPLNIYLD